MPTVTEGITKAFELLIWFFACNMQYPKECFNSLVFLRRQVFKVFDMQKAPINVQLVLS